MEGLVVTTPTACRLGRYEVGRTTENTEITEEEMNEGNMVDEGHLNSITERIIGAAIEVHRALGPGLLESTYHACLACELKQQGLEKETEKELRPGSIERRPG